MQCNLQFLHKKKLYFHGLFFVRLLSNYFDSFCASIFIYLNIFLNSTKFVAEYWKTWQIWVKVFKNRQSKIWGRQPLKNLK